MGLVCSSCQGCRPPRTILRYCPAEVRGFWGGLDPKVPRREPQLRCQCGMHSKRAGECALF